MIHRDSDTGRRKIVITGAAGLVGQNLVDLLTHRGATDITAIDKHEGRLAALASRHPCVHAISADLADSGEWEAGFQDAAACVQLQMQAKAKDRLPFQRNNVQSTERVLLAMKQYRVPYLLHISSQSVHSASEDNYSITKKIQERLVLESRIKCCVLRPSLLYGPRDPKHLGWIADAMAKSPFFPIPGDGKFERRPIFVGDFCQILKACLDREQEGIFDLAGEETVFYVDMLKEIRRAIRKACFFVPVPIPVFRIAMRAAALVLESPPFTADQLAALTVGDKFDGVDMARTFGVRPTSFRSGIRRTFGKEKGQNP